MGGDNARQQARIMAAEAAESSLRPIGDILTLALAVTWPVIAVVQAAEGGLSLTTWLSLSLAVAFAMQAGARWALRLRTSPKAGWLYRTLEWRAGNVYSRHLARPVEPSGGSHATER